MKKMIVLVGLMMSMTTVSAAELIKMPVLDLLPTDFGNSIEIKTTKFDKVILDCQSLVGGMSFSSNDELASNVILDMFQCDETMKYLYESRQENLPVCIGLDTELSELYITRETGDDCL